MVEGNINFLTFQMYECILGTFFFFFRIFQYNFIMSLTSVDLNACPLCLCKNSLNQVITWAVGFTESAPIFPYVEPSKRGCRCRQHSFVHYKCSCVYVACMFPSL